MSVDPLPSYSYKVLERGRRAMMTGWLAAEFPACQLIDHTHTHRIILCVTLRGLTSSPD